MKAQVQYRIDTVYPHQSGLSRIVYNVIGSWVENGKRFTNGLHCVYGCENFRTARNTLRRMVKEMPTVIV